MPILIGSFYPLMTFLAGVSVTAYLANVDASSIIAVEIWVLTKIFTEQTKKPWDSHVVLYPVFGIITHFILIIFIAAIATLAELNASGKELFGGNTLALPIVAFSIMLVSVLVAWYVREVIWKYERLES